MFLLFEVQLLAWEGIVTHIGTFEDELIDLKKDLDQDQFDYHRDRNKEFTKVSTQHFEKTGRKNSHGVYVVRQRSTGEVLYIGRGGKINPDGQFKKQGILGRLNNVKGKIEGRDIPANEWFGNLSMEKGPLVIEYIILTSVPKSPALVEAVLLQAYLNEHGCLPYKNNEY